MLLWCSNVVPKYAVPSVDHAAIVNRLVHPLAIGVGGRNGRPPPRHSPSTWVSWLSAQATGSVGHHAAHLRLLRKELRTRSDGSGSTPSMGFPTSVVIVSSTSATKRCRVRLGSEACRSLGSNQCW